MIELTTKELFEIHRQPNVKLIDIRPVDAYNGWRFHNENRGGHIPYAKSLPAKWINYIDWLDIVESKNIKPENRLVVYGYDRDITQTVAARFEKAGYPNVDVYHKFAKEWCPDDSLPMHKLTRYNRLVPASWLHTLINNDTAPEYDNDKYVVCHAHYQNPNAYEQGHIPGAIELDTNRLESPDTWNRRSPQELQETLQQCGITHDTTVILYGRFSFPKNEDPFPGSSAGHLGAIRCAFIMMYAGVQDVRILNGGLQAWMDAGLDLSTKRTDPKPVSDFGADIPMHPELAVDTPEAREILQTKGKNLVSVRSWREFIGEVSGYNYIEKKGRIPGAVFGNCGSDAYHMENYRNLDHTTREYHEIEELWAKSGITADTYNAFYCGTGWRGSEAFLNAWLMGWPRIAVYDGGWFEWSSDENNPCETGIPSQYQTAVSIH